MSNNTAEKIQYLRSLPSIRSRCSQLFALAQTDSLDYWTLDLSVESDIVDFVCSLIKRDYGDSYDSIPPHGRWRHFVGNRVDPLLAAWRQEKNVGPIEIARRLVDLMVVSVLLDAGAGNTWKYQPKEKDSAPIARSEGLGVGSLEMFEKGFFSGLEGQPCRVDAIGLSKISSSQIATALQVSEANPMDGIEGRAQLLISLGKVLSSPSLSRYFTQGNESRPGHIVDYLLNHPSSQQCPSPTSTSKMSIKIETLWDVVVNGLSGVWPEGRTKFEGVGLGDVWPVNSLSKHIKGKPDDESLVPFHKLSQWLSYSLIEVMEKILEWNFVGKDQMTGLPEYRNGGLLVDFALLKPKIPALLKSFNLPSTPISGETGTTLMTLPPFHASHPAIVEFRAVTVIMLDRLAEGIRKKTGEKGLSLPQVLEAGTWKAGREIAKKLRPETGGPPFQIVSDGTIF